MLGCAQNVKVKLASRLCGADHGCACNIIDGFLSTLLYKSPQRGEMTMQLLLQNEATSATLEMYNKIIEIIVSALIAPTAFGFAIYAIAQPRSSFEECATDDEDDGFEFRVTLGAVAFVFLISKILNKKLYRSTNVTVSILLARQREGEGGATLEPDVLITQLEQLTLIMKRAQGSLTFDGQHYSYEIEAAYACCNCAPSFTRPGALELQASMLLDEFLTLESIYESAAQTARSVPATLQQDRPDGAGPLQVDTVVEGVRTAPAPHSKALGKRTSARVLPAAPTETPTAAGGGAAVQAPTTTLTSSPIAADQDSKSPSKCSLPAESTAASAGTAAAKVMAAPTADHDAPPAAASQATTMTPEQLDGQAAAAVGMAPAPEPAAADTQDFSDHTTLEIPPSDAAVHYGSFWSAAIHSTSALQRYFCAAQRRNACDILRGCIIIAAAWLHGAGDSSVQQQAVPGLLFVVIESWLHVAIALAIAVILPLVHWFAEQTEPC